MPFHFSLRLGRHWPTRDQNKGPEWCQKRHCTNKRCKKRHNDPVIVHHCGHQHIHSAPTNAQDTSSRNAPPALKKQAPANPQTACRLFSLPTEIRLTICALVFSIPKGTADLGRLPSNTHLAVLQTCRRILLEAEDVFYTLHRFVYHFGTRVHTFYNTLLPLNPHRRNAIQRLTIIVSNGAAAYGIIQELHHLPRLRSLYISRADSVRFISLSHWHLLAEQMRDQLAKMECLEEVKVIWPEMKRELAPWEVERSERLKQVDEMLENGWRGGS